MTRPQGRSTSAIADARRGLICELATAGLTVAAIADDERVQVSEARVRAVLRAEGIAAAPAARGRPPRTSTLVSQAASAAGMTPREWVTEGRGTTEALELIVELAQPALDGLEPKPAELLERLRLAGRVAVGDQDDRAAARAWLQHREQPPVA